MFVFQRMWLCVPAVVVALMSLDRWRVLFSDSECIRPWCFCPYDNYRSINTFSKCVCVYIYIYIYIGMFYFEDYISEDSWVGEVWAGSSCCSWDSIQFQSWSSDLWPSSTNEYEAAFTSAVTLAASARAVQVSDQRWWQGQWWCHSGISHYRSGKHFKVIFLGPYNTEYLIKMK